jgi:hypothetical protein
MPICHSGPARIFALSREWQVYNNTAPGCLYGCGQKLAEFFCCRLKEIGALPRLTHFNRMALVVKKDLAVFWHRVRLHAAGLRYEYTYFKLTVLYA